MTLGEYRVDLNPSDDPRVDEVKRAAAALIDLMLPLTDQTNNGEVIRLAELAGTAFEEGAMWAVKAMTRLTPPPTPQ